MAFQFALDQIVLACVNGNHGRGRVVKRDEVASGNLYYVVLEGAAGEGFSAEHQLLEIGLRLDATKLTALTGMLRLHCGCGL